MRKVLLFALLASGSLLTQGQTKGTENLGMGMNFRTQKSHVDQYYSERSSAIFSLGYGFYLKDNEKIGLTVFFGKNKSLDVLTDTGLSDEREPHVYHTYGGTLSYQKYYPLLKNFNAYAGGRTGYSLTDDGQSADNLLINSYSAGVNGGVSWLLFKRLALEADLISADLIYRNARKQSSSKATSTQFDVRTTGSVNGLGFKIYFVF